MPWRQRMNLQLVSQAVSQSRSSQSASQPAESKRKRHICGCRPLQNDCRGDDARPSIGSGTENRNAFWLLMMQLDNGSQSLQKAQSTVTGTSDVPAMKRLSTISLSPTTSESEPSPVTRNRGWSSRWRSRTFSYTSNERYPIAAYGIIRNYVGKKEK